MSTGRKNHTISLKDIDEEPLADELTCQASLRQAVYDGVSGADAAAIVKGIVERAKEGDPRAVKQFFDYVVGAPPSKITVNNHFESVEDAAEMEARKRQVRLARQTAN